MGPFQRFRGQAGLFRLASGPLSRRLIAQLLRAIAMELRKRVLQFRLIMVVPLLVAAYPYDV